MASWKVCRLAGYVVMLVTIGCGEANRLADEAAPRSTDSAQIVGATRALQAQVEQRSELQFELPVHGGKADIHATVYENQRVARGETVLAVHGLAATGVVFRTADADILDKIFSLINSQSSDFRSLVDWEGTQP